MQQNIIQVTCNIARRVKLSLPHSHDMWLDPRIFSLNYYYDAPIIGNACHTIAI